MRQVKKTTHLAPFRRIRSTASDTNILFRRVYLLHLSLTLFSPEPPNRAKEGPARNEEKEKIKRVPKCG